jgi:hypothetical protein
LILLSDTEEAIVFHRRHVLNKYFKIGTKSSQLPLLVRTESEWTSMIRNAADEAFLYGLTNKFYYCFLKTFLLQ